MVKNLFFLGALFGASTLFGQTIVFEENFDMPETQKLWTIGDLDGDADSWEFLDATANELPNFSGKLAASFSWYWEAFNPDNTLTSPVIKLPADADLTLDFKVASGDVELFDEHYAVFVIPANSTFTGSETPVFEETLDASYEDVAKNINVDISSYAGQDVQLVFRHYNSPDIFYIGMDDVRITKENLSTTEVNQSKAVVYQDQVNSLVKIANVNQVERVKLFDLAGNLLIDVKQSEANISSLPKGIYIVNFYTGDNVISRKIVKK